MRWCINCGGPGGQYHHAIPKSICEAGRHASENEIRLCPPCHSGWHDGSVVIYRDILRHETQAWLGEHASEGWLKHWYPVRPEALGIF